MEVVLVTWFCLSIIVWSKQMFVDRKSLKSQIKSGSIYDKNQRDNKVNILVLAKQSDEPVISALFHRKKVDVNVGFSDNKIYLKRYDLNHAIIWGIFSSDDGRDYCDIVNRFLQYNPNGFKIDLALVFLNDNCTDCHTNSNLLSNVVLKNMSPDKVLIVINQIDKAIEDSYWDFDNKKPKPELIKYLDEKIKETHQWIHAKTGCNVPMPICCNIKQQYNIHGLLQFIIDNLPRRQVKRRVNATIC